MTNVPWEALAAHGELFTCYSSALAAWLALEHADWPARVDSGLHLALTEEGDGLFGFSHFPPALRADLGLVRRAADDPAQAAAAILAEVEREGRAIVAGDGHNLPWHVAQGRRHVPHWFTVAAGLEILDPFRCRTDLGQQRPTRRALTPDELPGLLGAVPAPERVLQLREAFALGDDARPLPAGTIAWLERDPAPAPPRGAADVAGPQALLRLAEHFRDRGADPAAYRQADDVWSIARHRAFLAHRAEGAWAQEHAAPLAARWAHIAPLLMQARLAAEAGRAPSPSVRTTLEDLSSREAEASIAAG